MNELKKYSCIKQCIIFATPYNKCIERDKLRTRVVEEYVIKRMYMTWNTPYYYEGWDEISVHYSDGARKSLGKPLDFIAKYMNYSQDTPYHAESLGVHMKAVGDYVMNMLECRQDENIVYSAYLHDCGKPFTKAFKDSKGNPCEIAHYYQHQCVGAYDAMFFDFDNKRDEDILEISCLVNLHMDPFNWQKLKTQEKYKNLWGEDIFNKIMLIHDADMKSSIKIE